MSDKIKLSCKQVNNITAEWGDQFCSITAWQNGDGADITFSNVPPVSLDHTQITTLLAVISNYTLLNKLDPSENIDFKKNE